MIPAFMLSGLSFPITTLMFGLIKYGVRVTGYDHNIYKDQRVEFNIKNIPDYSLLFLSMLSCLRFKF